MASPNPLSIPLFYRIMLQWFEPAAAATGAAMAVLQPAVYLESMNPHIITPASEGYRPEYQVVLDQLAGTYFLFAFLEAVVLRATGELRVWKVVLVGILLCDAVHFWATARALGAEAFWDPRLWRWQDWVNLGMLYGMLPVRLGVIFEVGFPAREKRKAA